MKIVLASDHAGFELKQKAIELIKNNYKDIEVIDCGTDSEKSTDYPIYGVRGAKKIQDGEADRGIFICGTGIGISIAASKIGSVLAPVIWTKEQVIDQRKNSNKSTIALGARTKPYEESLEIIKAFIETEFDGQIKGCAVES